MNPYYSIAELARLLDDDDARVADALVACGVPLIYEGKPADLSRWERIQPRKFNSDGAQVIYVMTGGSDPFPSSEAVVVSADALPESWTIRLKGLLGEPGSDSPIDVEKPLLTTERNTLLTIIAALCDYSAIKHQARGAASQIARLTEEIGASVSGDTVKRVLEKIPDALDARKK